MASHPAIACSSSAAAACRDGNAAGNARLIGPSSLLNSLAAPGNASSRWARSWLHAPARCAMRSLRARTAARSAAVAAESGASGRSRARSVRSASASTNESNRSSLAPDEPYRDRRFLTCREPITTTVRPAASSVSASTPSPRSIATSPAPFLPSRAISPAIPARSCATANWSVTRPAMSTTHTA